MTSWKVFESPTSILIAGPSGSGKTYFVSRILEDPQYYFKNVKNNIHYVHGSWQPAFASVEKRGIQFHENLPTVEDLDAWFSKTKGGILVLDDVMNEAVSSPHVVDLFTKHSHHRNINVIYLCQDLFPPGRYARPISRNAHYIIIFRNLRDTLATLHLLMQSFGHEWKKAFQAYKEATSKVHGYLIINVHPRGNERCRLFTDVLKEEKPARCFLDA